MRLVPVIVSLALPFVAAAAPVSAQPVETPAADQPAEKAADARPAKTSVLSRFRFHVNGGAQVTSHDMVAQGAFPLFDETATFEVRGETGGGAVFDIGAVYPIRRQFFKGELFGGLSYSRVGGDVGGPLTGQIPHPLIFDSPRPISGSVSGLNHVQHALHFQAVWLHPISNKIDIALSAGPTLFIVSQDLVSSISLTEAGSSVSLAGTTIQNVSDNAAGFNVGMDGSYRLTRRLAVGAFVRYTGGSVDLPAASGNVPLDVGGVQVGAGVRLRFR